MLFSMNSLPESQGHRRRPPRCRLLFDENLPWRVASALWELKYHTSYVGNQSDGTPARGSSDQAIINHARTMNQVIVTPNYDMILLCLEQHQSVIWLDPRGPNLTWEEMVVLVFRAAREWEDLLQSATGPACIRALRTKNESLSVERAKHLVRQRMKRIAARERKASQPRPLGSLFDSASS